MNLAGCYLSNQLPTMTGLAWFYCCLQCVMFSQYLYFKFVTKSVVEAHHVEGVPDIFLFSPSSMPYIQSPNFAQMAASRRRKDAAIAQSQISSTSSSSSNTKHQIAVSRARKNTMPDLEANSTKSKRDL